jgi:hypothetical protein
MTKLKISVSLLVIGAMTQGASAIAAPATPLSVSAKPMPQESELVQVRYGGWHGGGWHGGWGGWHGGRGFPAGAFAGALIGGAIAGPYYGGGYGYPAQYYGYPGYDRGYANYRCHPYCRWGG